MEFQVQGGTTPGVVVTLGSGELGWLRAQALAPYLVTDREAAEVGAAGVGAAILGGLLEK